MLLNPTSVVIDLLGIIIGFVFAFIGFGVVKRITDEALKSFFRWMGAGVALATLSFVSDLVGEIFNIGFAEIFHHILMLLTLFIFVLASINLSQEVK